MVNFTVANKNKGENEKGKGKQESSRTLLEALAMAIDGTNQEEAVRLAAEFNNSFGHLVRASVEAESARGNGREEDSEVPLVAPRREDNRDWAPMTPADSVKAPAEKRRVDVPSSSEDSDKRKPRKKKSRKCAYKKKHSQNSDLSPGSDDSLETSSSLDESSLTDSSQEEEAELCYEITDFESADLPDLPDKWDKGFKKLISYVPLTLFNPALLESFYDDDGDTRERVKTSKLKNSLKTLEKRLTYGDFIEMSDLEERYAREIYGLDTYADYVVKHKKIVSELKKTYNCWMIGLRYHLKVRTVIFRRRKLIKSKVKGKTVLKDKVKIPNGLQPMVERQARHDADRAGDLQYVDNPYAPGGAKYGFNFATGRAPVPGQNTTGSAKVAEEAVTPSLNHRGRRGGSGQKPYVGRVNSHYPRVGRYGNRLPYHPEVFNTSGQVPPAQMIQLPPSQPSRMYMPYRNARQNALGNVQRIQPADARTM